MSTFKGVVSEFPNIRIDFFRKGDGLPPPLACFLSHVHSDHLLGLESLKAPFVYCSPATKEILLRLEKFPSRMNFAKGILETRKQTYKHLRLLLKTIPLETPTTIELRPGNEIKVTLFDANHCVGAVMFLIEGNGKSILYTGDIRSEDWWIRSLAQNPILLPYAAGIKKLDTIYLDTTFATKNKLYRNFPSKADGIAELLRKVALYPKDTIFYLHSWTFGYENVWLALSSFLGSQIHLDEYRWGLYQSLSASQGAIECPEAVQFNGFKLGHHTKEGCLTDEPGSRIHSCEKGSGCPILGGQSHVVVILPVITRRDDGIDVHELGTGGGQGDLDQVQELDVHDQAAVQALLELCAQRIHDSRILNKVQHMLESCSKSRRARMRLESHFNSLSFDGVEAAKKLTTVVDELVVLAEKSPPATGQNSNTTDSFKANNLPDIITFPYSRHSSYLELRALVTAFAPKSIYPCTVDEPNWNPTLSMKSLFGDLCAGDHFDHDEEMKNTYFNRFQDSSISNNKDTQEDSQYPETQNQDTQNQESKQTLPSEAETQTSEIPFHTAPGESQASNISLPAYNDKDDVETACQSIIVLADNQTPQSSEFLTSPASPQHDLSSSVSVQEVKVTPNKASIISPPPIKRHLVHAEEESTIPLPSIIRAKKVRREKTVAQYAYDAAVAGEWAEFGGLVCARQVGSQELCGLEDSETGEDL